MFKETNKKVATIIREITVKKEEKTNNFLPVWLIQFEKNESVKVSFIWTIIKPVQIKIKNLEHRRENLLNILRTVLEHFRKIFKILDFNF